MPWNSPNTNWSRVALSGDPWKRLNDEILDDPVGARVYDATYRGQIAGKSLRLSGAQQWRLPGTITLSRSE